MTKILEGIEYAKATLAMEGLNVSEEQVALVEKLLKGEITKEEFKMETKRIAANV